MTHSETISTFDCQVRDQKRSVTTISMIYHISWVKKKEGWVSAVTTAAAKPTISKTEQIWPGMLEVEMKRRKDERQSHRIFEKARNSKDSIGILVSSIEYVEGDGHYCRIHSEGKTILTYDSLSEVVEKSDGVLIRTQKSYALNPIYTVAINRSVVTMMSGANLKIPRGKYEEVKQQLCWKDE